MAAGMDTTDPAPVGAHPMLAALAGVRAALVDTAASDAWWSLSERDVVAGLGSVLAVRSATEAITASLVGQAQTRGIYTQVAATNTTGWLRRKFQLSLTEARRLSTLAAELPRWAQVELALAQGRLSAEAAAAITGVLNALPDTASAAELTRAEALLVTQAHTLDPEQLGLCGRALTEALTVTPDVDDPAEVERLAQDVEDAQAREAAEWERRAVRLIARRDGMLGITGALDALSGALVREILEAAARPVDAVDGVTDDRYPGQRMADALTELITTIGPLDLDQDAGMTTPAGDDAQNGADPDGEDADPDDLEDPDDPDDLDDEDDEDDEDDGESQDPGDPGDPGDLDAADRADAGGIGVLGEPVLDFGFDTTGAPHTHRGADIQQAVDTGTECCAGANRAHRRAHRAGTGHRKRSGRRQPPTARPGVTVSLIVDWGMLQAGLAGGTLPDGTVLSPAATLAALCDAGVIPMIFNGPGLPLHVGRARREFTPAQRRAFAARDCGCTFPGCHRRASVSTAHHLIHWEDGGLTDIDNGALLCRYHHQLVHREGWVGRLDARGRPEYRPPATIDPEQRPRQHLRFATAA